MGTEQRRVELSSIHTGPSGDAETCVKGGELRSSQHTNTNAAAPSAFHMASYPAKVVGNVVDVHRKQAKGLNDRR